MTYAFETYIADNTRFLFRKGDTFTTDETIHIGHFSTTYTGGVISSYEDSSNPSDDKPILFSNSNDGTASAVLTIYFDDWRIYDVSFKSGGYDTSYSGTGFEYPSGLNSSSYNPCNNTLVLNCDFSYLGGLAIALYGTQNTIQGCNASYIGTTGIFTTVTEKFTVIGNTISDFQSDYEEHLLRCSGCIKGYIAQNDFRANDTKTNIQIRAADAAPASYYVVLYKNYLDRVVGFNPTNDS